jgi:hypothetical protein
VITRTIQFLFAAALTFAMAGCPPGAGERCNPLRFNDECGAGLACIYPANCGVAFCCPPPADMSSASMPPMCTYPPGCSGDGCCPLTPISDESNRVANCQPCGVDGGTSD